MKIARQDFQYNLNLNLITIATTPLPLHVTRPPYVVNAPNNSNSYSPHSDNEAQILSVTYIHRYGLPQFPPSNTHPLTPWRKGSPLCSMTLVRVLQAHSLGGYIRASRIMHIQKSCHVKAILLEFLSSSVIVAMSSRKSLWAFGPEAQQFLFSNSHFYFVSSLHLGRKFVFTGPTNFIFFFFGLHFIFLSIKLPNITSPNL